MLDLFIGLYVNVVPRPIAGVELAIIRHHNDLTLSALFPSIASGIRFHNLFRELNDFREKSSEDDYG